MSELTREHFDQEIGKLNARFAPLATKQGVREGVDELARMVKAGFDATDKNFTKLTEMLQVRKDVEDLKSQILEIRQALNLKA